MEPGSLRHIIIDDVPKYKKQTKDERMEAVAKIKERLKKLYGEQDPHAGFKRKTMCEYLHSVLCCYGVDESSSSI